MVNSLCDGQLTLAIEIFKGTYPRPFMNQLVASQLDMDRLDYLKRDSFYTGVAEGNINADRLIDMMNVVDDQLVIEWPEDLCIGRSICTRSRFLRRSCF
ncbi:MAG: hypothetical protein RLZZ463_772 [Bacteroidota bacterium]